MPWSLRKFLSSKDQHSPAEGGDKVREKKGKSSKQGKSDKKRQQRAKGGAEVTADDASYTSSQATREKHLLDPSKASKQSPDAKKIDISSGQSSDEASYVSADLISNNLIKSDDDFKSVDDHSGADCSNLTGYLETAILESAGNTLERPSRTSKGFPTGPSNTSADEPVNMDVTEENGDPDDAGSLHPPQQIPAESSFDAGLYVEYVNYDLVGADAGSGSSGEYYSSDDEADEKFLNSNNNSNREMNIETRELLRLAVPLAHGPGQDAGSVSDGEERQNYNVEERYYDRDEGSKDNKTEQEEGKSLGEVERNDISGSEDCNSTEKEHGSIDLGDYQGNAADNSPDCGDGGNTEAKRRTLEEDCPVHNGNVDLDYVGDTRDMEKARSIFGMCLCKNGEQMDNVTDLDYRNCNLKQVPHDIFQYAQTLTHLQLDSNTLSDLPKSLFSCENLEHLTVSDNDLGSLPLALAGLANLRYLDISKNVIEDVPDCIRCCKSLSVLDASVNPIERLSEGFTQLVGLNELYLNDCFLEFLPANFGRLVQLTVLELRDNQLQILPKSIKRLNLLKRLDLGGNIFQEWPHVVCELRKLTELWLDGNELSNVPDEVGELTSLVYLDLSRNFIEAIPSQIGSLRELSDLLLCENHITTLPDTIGFLDKVTMLKASMNQLSAVPESIGKLREIEELDLSHNKLTEIPSTIGNLTEMHTLLLDNNVLGSIPAELGKCGRLNVLQLSRNLLEKIPREIGDLSQLRVFNICRNRLSHLPITVIKLAQLEALWVSSNQSKPNVPLHAELAPDGRTRILTNILFPQMEQDSAQIREKTDQDGYANDTADDDEPPLFRKQRGVTRVAFNLDPVCREDSVTEDEDDEDMCVNVPLLPPKDQNSNKKFHSDHHSVDVSSVDILSNGLRVQQNSLMVRLPARSDDLSVETNENSPEGKAVIEMDTSTASSTVEPMMGVEEWPDPPPAYIETLGVADTPSVTSDVVPGNDMNALSQDLAEKSTTLAPQSISVPDLRKAPVVDDVAEASKSVMDVTPAGEEDDALTPKIKTWSSHTHLPSIPTTGDIVSPVAAEIISNRSSMSSSPSFAPEESPKPELPPKTFRLPIPSRAIFDQSSKKVPEPVEKPKEVPHARPPISPKTPNKDPLVDIPFVDSDISEEGETGAKAPATTKVKKVKPPPPPRKDSLLSKCVAKLADPSNIKPPVPQSKPTLSSSTGLKVFTPALLHRQKQNDDMHDTAAMLPSPMGPKNPLESSPDGLPPTDHDSGVGNDADSQESIPEHDEDLHPQDVAMETPPTCSFTAPKPQTVKSVANFHVADVRTSAPGKSADPKSPPSYAPIILPSNSSQPPPVAAKMSHLPNKIAASIKMFENISLSPEHKPQQPPSKSLADLLPTGPRKTEEKAVIRPNNHLNGFVRETSPSADMKPEVTSPADLSTSPLKQTRQDYTVLPEQQPAVTAFLRSDDEIVSDASAFTKALADMTSSPEKKKVSRASSSGESAKQSQFRERLEKIMQQQKGVSAATKGALNGGTALSLSRKTSFNANLSQPTSPAGSGLAKLEPEYSVSPDPVPSPKKSHVSSDRVKSKLDRTGSGTAKSASSSRIARTRPGSAPAAQLLQRRNSNQRNSIAAPENGQEEKRTLAPLYVSDTRTGMNARSRSKSIEQQLGQLFLDSDEERLNHDERTNFERHHNDDVIRREHRLKDDASGIRGSRNSLCSPPPVRHNMYAKARSSTNATNASLADWKHKLLQHIERKRLEKQHITALQSMGRPTTQQPQRSLGKIKSPPRTSGTAPKQTPYYNVAQPQPRKEPTYPNNHRQTGKSVPTAMSPTKTVTNTHQYIPEGPGVRSHFSGQSRAAKLAKQRTFTPGPENHGVAKMVAPRPKSAMDKFLSQPQTEPTYAEPPTYHQPHQSSFYADLRSHKQQQQPPLPTYEDHLHRRAVPRDPPQNLVRSESTRKSFRSSSRGRPIYEDMAGYPLRQAGSHESLMDAARHNQHDAYFPTTPLRNASSHDSVLDQPPYQPASYASPYYGSPPQQQRYPSNHVPQRYPVADNPGRSKYASPDYATYVNVYDYDRSPVEYHNRPQVQDPYRAQMGYRGSVRADQRQLQRADYAQNQGNYSNYAYPAGNFRDPRRPPTYDQHYRQRETLSPNLYRPLAEREDGSVASAFRPYQQAQHGVVPSHKAHHHNPYMQAYGLPPNQAMSPPDYQGQRNAKQSQGRHAPPSNYQYVQEQSRHLSRPPPGWADQQEDFERVTVSVRRSPTFGFHVMGGVGAGGNPYRPMDDGVFVTHVSPGGAADNKLQAGDKILLVNGSDFVGISHKRAVDLLRNAGQVAVLVVERSLGKPV